MKPLVKAPRRYGVQAGPVLLLLAVFVLSGCTLTNVRGIQSEPTATVPVSQSTPRPTTTSAAQNTPRATPVEPTRAPVVTPTTATTTGNPGGPSTGGTGSAATPVSPNAGGTAGSPPVNGPLSEDE